MVDSYFVLDYVLVLDDLCTWVLGSIRVRVLALTTLTLDVVLEVH